MITVYFPKYLQSLTGDVDKQNFDTDSMTTVVNGLRTLFPKLSVYITNITSNQVKNIVYFISKENKTIIKNSITGKLKETEIVLIITLYGQGDDIGTIALGAALIAASFIPGLQGITIPLLGGTLTGMLFSAGVTYLASGILSALTSVGGQSAVDASATPNDAAVRSDNDAFQGLTNTTSTNTAIPLIYGHHRVAGQFIGGRIKTINHDRDTIINVSNYV